MTWAPHPPDYLDRLFRLGRVDRVARGLYAWPDAEVSEHHSLAEILLRPRGGPVPPSAPRFHGLTTQSPREVWLTRASRGPRGQLPEAADHPGHGSGAHRDGRGASVEGIAVKVYSPAKTVADCFKHRSKVGWTSPLGPSAIPLGEGKRRWMSSGSQPASAGWRT